MGFLTRAYSCKRPALVTTTFSNSRGGRLRELRLYPFQGSEVKENIPWPPARPYSFNKGVPSPLPPFPLPFFPSVVQSPNYRRHVIYENQNRTVSPVVTRDINSLSGMIWVQRQNDHFFVDRTQSFTSGHSIQSQAWQAFIGRQVYSGFAL